MSNRWYYKLMGEEIGPLSAAELRQHAFDGRVTPETYVRRADNDRWVTADLVRGLFDKPSSPSRESGANVPPSLTAPPASKAPTLRSPSSQDIADSPRQPTLATRMPHVPVIWVTGGAITLLVFLAVTVAFLLVVGCSGDPTARFKSFVEAARTKAEADKELTNSFDFESFGFDVEKTDSTISPYSARVVITAVDKYHAAQHAAILKEDHAAQSLSREEERLSRLIHDAGDREFLFLYAYQDDKWVLTVAKAEGSSQWYRDSLAKLGPPRELTKHFTP